jgi:hypothetical protein
VIPNRLLAALLCVALLVGGCGTTADLANQTDDGPSVAQESYPLEATYGIRVEGLRLSAAGSMLDFRYRVVDAEKAAAMLDGRVQPYLFDAAHGAKLGVPDTPVLGRIRQTARNNKILTNRTYFIMFGNPAKLLQSGDKVTLLLGSVKVSDLTVQ